MARWDREYRPYKTYRTLAVSGVASRDDAGILSLFGKCTRVSCVCVRRKRPNSVGALILGRKVVGDLSERGYIRRYLGA